MGWVQAVGQTHPVLWTPLPGGDLALQLPADPLSVLSRTQVTEMLLVLGGYPSTEFFGLQCRFSLHRGG